MLKKEKSLKKFPSNSQFKSKQKQKLERWLVGLEFTRENNQNNNLVDIVIEFLVTKKKFNFHKV